MGLTKMIANIKHFTLEELSCRDGCGLKPSNRATIALQAVRYEYGKPMTVTRGASCSAHNKKIGGAESSKHIADNDDIEPTAFDVVVENSWDRFRLVSIAIKHGFNGIGIGKKFVHMDMRPEEEGRIWHYYEESV